MSPRTERFVEALLLPINPAAVVLLGVYTVLWGFWVANPWWTVFTQASLYSGLVEWAPLMIPPEYFWGLIAMACGCITIYGSIRRRYRPLVVGASVAGWHWFMISIFYFMGDWANTGGITALIFAVYGAFIYLNLKVNFGERRDMNDVLRK